MLGDEELNGVGTCGDMVYLAYPEDKMDGSLEDEDEMRAKYN